MELAVEAAQSRHLPDFLEQFALRATRMLDAIWGGVAVYRGAKRNCTPGKNDRGDMERLRRVVDCECAGKPEGGGGTGGPEGNRSNV